MKFHYCDDVIVAGNSFWTGTIGRVVDISAVTEPNHVKYQVEILKTHTTIWILGEELEPYKGLLDYDARTN
jgi:hypothetical protein